MVRIVLVKATVLILLFFVAFSCQSDEGSNPPGNQSPISTDEQLFRLVTQTQPFTTYTLFPRADSVTQGTLNGSQAHQPLVRVSMNAIARGALSNDTLPAGTTFPDGSIIFKQIRMNGQTILYAIIYKDSSNPLAGNGWLWAEYAPDGSVAAPISRKGSGCTGCHALEQGPQHDFVRTFERQR
jgi:hypothetical protein